MIKLSEDYVQRYTFMALDSLQNLYSISFWVERFRTITFADLNG
jgi:hypothetical protein